MQIIVQGKIIEATDLEEISEGMVDKITENITGMKDIVVTIEIGIGQRKELLQEVMVMEEIEALAMIDLDQGPGASTNRDRIRCYTCREYDHFVRDCPNSGEERDLEQLQNMLNMEEQDHRVESLDEDYRCPLNLCMAGMMPPHSYHYTLGKVVRVGIVTPQ